MHQLWQIKRMLWAALTALPPSVKLVAEIVWGLWLLAGELVKLVDAARSYPYVQPSTA